MHCDTALGYYWPSDDTSQGGSPASGPQLVTSNSNCGERETMDKGGTAVFSSNCTLWQIKEKIQSLFF